MQYTLMAVGALAAAAFLAVRARLAPKPLAALAAAALFFQLVFDNLMTAQGLWVFDFSHTLGIAVPTIPLENLLFGLALALATVVSWEAQGRR
ncbi:MAG: lycopene cyclase domain-containing protein [Candidatus Micrarchaeota archaeon]|nr:lycopene cyclase domain-containing protein [Candidatus Micrarchaeota archaeon]